MAIAVRNLNLPRRHLRDPIDSFQVDREFREIKDTLGSFPLYAGQDDPEGQLLADTGSLYLRIENDVGRLYLKSTGNRTTTGWVEITGDFVFNSTGAITLPRGTTAERPANPVAGMFRFNTDAGVTEFYDGNVWI